MKFNRFLLIILAFALSACEHAPVAEPPSTQQVIVVSLPVSLEPISSGLNKCAQDQPGIALFIDNLNDEISSRSDLSITLGAPTSPAGFAASLAIEDLVVILNNSNTLFSLSTSVLRAIYAGQITEWAKAGSNSGTIQVWDYPDSDPLQRIFDQAVLKGSPVTSLAYLAPTPSAMLEAVAANPQAVGFLPKAWLDTNKVHTVKLEADISAGMHLPVLALAPHEPQGVLRRFVACLQAGNGSTTILQHYQPFNP